MFRAGNSTIASQTDRLKDAEMTESYPFSDNLGYLLNRCAGQMAMRIQKELEPFGISLAQWGAMLASHERCSASPSDVAARVGIDRGATSRLIARMEAKGLVERRMHDDDGRSVVLFLSSAAQANMPDLIARSKRVNRDVLALLPEDDGKALLASLSRLIDVLQD